MPGTHRNAPEPQGQVHQPHRHRERHLARAARCALPGAVRPPVRGDGAVMAASLEQIAASRALGHGRVRCRRWRRCASSPRGATPATPDELWLLEHPPVYTLGLAADTAHGPDRDNGIPVVQAERGGEITYHGPGQVVLYTLVDLARRGIKVKQFVWLLEQSVIDLLGRARRSASRARPGSTSTAPRSPRSASACRAAARSTAWR